MENSKIALELKSELDHLRPINREQEDRIMQKFRLDWNYHSNHLEGNSLTYGETKALILFGVTAQGKPLKDHFEITGHNEAINWVLDIVNGDYPLTENFIRELHTLLLKESYEVDAITPDGKPTKKRITVGGYKTTPNHVKTKTGEVFYFATPEETPAKMTDLIDWYREKAGQEDVNPIFLAAEFHYKFIRIHPFDDGNGRTARILMNFILMKFGYPPVIIKTEEKEDYFAVLQLADVGNIEPFVEFIAKNMIRSLEIMISGAKGESIEEPDDLDKEIALLEQKVKSFGGEIEITKSKESILNIYDDSLKRLYDKFIISCTKLEKFYNENEFHLFIDGGGITNDFLRERERINENIKQISFAFYHKVFNRENYGEFNYKTSLNINLNLNKYIVFDGQIIFSEKTYSEQLTDEEINKIMNTISKKHISFIEQKMAEKEKN